MTAPLQPWCPRAARQVTQSHTLDLQDGAAAIQKAKRSEPRMLYCDPVAWQLALL
jgi:hypothetical protein